MDMLLDHEGRPARTGIGGAGRLAGAPEWHRLRMRLMAGLAARDVPGEGRNPGRRLAAGSFDRASARALAGYGEPLPGVNAVFWADGNLARRMEAVVAGRSRSGDRGKR